METKYLGYRFSSVKITASCLGIWFADKRLWIQQTKHLQCATSWFQGNVRVKPYSKHSATPPLKIDDVFYERTLALFAWPSLPDHKRPKGSISCAPYCLPDQTNWLGTIQILRKHFRLFRHPHSPIKHKSISENKQKVTISKRKHGPIRKGTDNR